MNLNLATLGWCDSLAEAFAAHAALGRKPARVASQHRDAYDVFAEDGVWPAEVTGRFRHQAAVPGDFPVVGDWVAIETHADKATLHAVLPRRTKVSRTIAGGPTEEQVLAANVDHVFIVASLAADLNLRRLERSLALAWESGAQPGVLLAKADLCPDVAGKIESVCGIAAGVPVLALSGVTGDGLDALRSFFKPGLTAVLLGPSGVGKSTLVNSLTGTDHQDVIPVRDDDQKGRHTTTRRELICLPSGGMVIDTPGLRELQLWGGQEGLGESFADIEQLAALCRFTDCQHESEPGCAVRDAVAQGRLEPGRLESHRKLQREQAFFNRRHDARAQAGQRRRVKTIAKGLRARKELDDEP